MTTKAKETTKSKAAVIFHAVLALALVGVGAGMIYLPAAPLSVGFLWWIDQSWFGER